MKANLSPSLSTALANATKTRLDTGAGAKVASVYDKLMPATPQTAITDQVKLIDITITPGTWTVNGNGELVIGAGASTAALTSGIAKWARLFDGDGVAVMDVDVSSINGTGFLKLTTIAVAATAPVAISGGTIKFGG